MAMLLQGKRAMLLRRKKSYSSGEKASKMYSDFLKGLSVKPFMVYY